MLQYLPSPEEVTFITTNQCNVKCSHCVSASSPERHEHLLFEDMRMIVDAIASEHRLKVVTFSGGEPTLLGDDLLDSIAHVGSMGITTRVVTNAKWAKSESVARARLLELRDAGLAEINFSTDDYHVEHIPLERVANAWRSSKGLGFCAVAIPVAHSVNSKITPQYIESFLGEKIPYAYNDDGSRRPLPPASADGTIYLISNSRVQILGRGREFVPLESIIPRRTSKLHGPCPLAHRQLAITPKRHLASCCGCEVEDNPVLDAGEIHSGADVKSLISSHNDHILMVAIATLGPAYLMDLVKDSNPEIHLNGRYSNVCEICEEVTRRPDVLEALDGHLPTIAQAILTAFPDGRFDDAAPQMYARPNVSH